MSKQPRGRGRRRKQSDLIGWADFINGLEQSAVLQDVMKLLRAVHAQNGKIMSAISDFAAKQKAHNEKMDAAIAGVNGDIEALNAKIAELQATSGQITAEDQALLDELEASGQAISEKLEALDALTPPTPPTA